MVDKCISKVKLSILKASNLFLVEVGKIERIQVLEIRKLPKYHIINTKAH